MAIKQIVPILITLQGDGSSTTFTYALSNLYQAGVGGSIPFGSAGVVPSSVTINNPPIAVTSSTVDGNGNITITFTAAPTNGVQYTLEVDLNYNSGAASSSSSVQSMNVNVTGGTITATESFVTTTGSAVPASAAYLAGKNAGNLVGVAVDASGNVGVNVVGALPTGANTIGAVTQASGPWTQNITQVAGSAISLGSKVSASSLPVVIASDQGAIPSSQSGTWTVRNQDGSGNSLTSTSGALDINLKTSAAAVTVAQASAASLNATVVGTGTFAVQAAQSGTWTAAQGTAGSVTAGWPAIAGQTAEASVAWTSATTSNTASTVTVTGYGTVMVTLNQTTTITGGVVTFEASDAGTNWYAITGVQVGGFTLNNQYTLVASTNIAFQFNVAGFTQFRVRLSTVIAGTATVNVGIIAQAETATTSVTVGQSTASNLNATVAQTTAANLNATVVGTGTFAVQSAQSGTWSTRMVGNAAGILDGAQNSVAPANALVIAGVYNSSAPTITSGNLTALQTDASGFLKVNVSAGSSGNAAASATGSAVPANADYAGVNVGGTLRGWTAANPSGSVYAGQIDLTSIGGSTTSTAATGVLKVGVVGSAGAAFDQAPGSAAPSNAIQVGGTDGTNTRAISTTAKGTQGAYAVTVQELKDSGRTYVTWFVDAVTLVTTEALISTQVNKGGTLQGAATTYTVTTGKTFRLQSISASVQGTNSSVQSVKVRFRSAASVTASSPVLAGITIANSGATNSIGYGEMDFPDGIEVAAGQQVGVSQLGGQVNGNVTICIAGYEY